MTYTYGTDPTAYNYGRLVSTAYGSFSGTYYDANGDYGTCIPGANATTYTDTYGYVAAGGVSSKTVTVSRRGQDDDGDLVTGNASMTVNYWSFASKLGDAGSQTRELNQERHP